MSSKLTRIFLILPILGLNACENKAQTQANRLIAKLSVEGVEVIGLEADLGEKRLISVNTFTDELSSQSIEHLYYAACDKLSDLYGERMVTYSFSDRMGYPGQVTIVQLNDESHGPFYIEARVFEANDSDSFWLSFVRGRFDPANDEKRMNKEKRPNWDLDGILRGNRSKSE